MAKPTAYVTVAKTDSDREHYSSEVTGYADVPIEGYVTISFTYTNKEGHSFQRFMYLEDGLVVESF